jgi:hypothetical protein
MKHQILADSLLSFMVCCAPATGACLAIVSFDTASAAAVQAAVPQCVQAWPPAR